MKINKSISNLMFTLYRSCIVLSLLINVLILTGCGLPETDDTYSPSLTETETRGGCNGGENDQYIQADLIFDREIGISENTAENLRITIGGDRVEDSKIDLEILDQNILRITIPVEKVTSGVLKIVPAGKGDFSGITDESGKYAACPFEVDTIVPSGAEFGIVQSGEGIVSAQVISAVNHRSIVWIRIEENGETVLPEGTGTDVLEGAAAVHEHDFLWATVESTAADIAETVERCYSGRLTAEASGDTVTVRSVSDEIQGKLGIEIFTR